MVSARGLPKMDVLGSCDAYVLLFLNEEGHNRYAADYMQFLSQQRRTRVVTSISPKWEESFLFQVTPRPALPALPMPARPVPPSR